MPARRPRLLVTLLASAIVATLAIFAIFPAVAAFQNPYGAPPTILAGQAGAQCLSRAEAEAFVSAIGNRPANTRLLGACILSGFSTYEIAASQSFGVPGSNIRVFKVSPQLVQDIWPNVSNLGDVLVVLAQGSGHYIFYSVVAGDEPVPDVVQPVLPVITVEEL